MKKVLLCALCITTLFYGCSGNNQSVTPCGNQSYLTAIINHSSLVRGRGDNLIIFDTFENKKTNEYFVVRDEETGHYILKNDSIEYPPVIRALKNNAAGYVKTLDHKLDSLGIREYSGEPDGLGILVKLYMKNGEVFFKTLPPKQITYPETLALINKSKSICEDWFSADE